MNKHSLTCPVCLSRAHYNSYHKYYICDKCGWNSDTNTLDILYKDMKSAPLSNLFPHKFEIDGITCPSMESFIQSLREKNVEIQKSICSNYSGMMAYKMRLCLNDWRASGNVYWKENTIFRESSEYIDLISRAYDALFD